MAELGPRAPQTAGRVLVIGIGNDYRGDDAAGLHVARRIRDAGPEGVTVQEASGDVATLIESWKDAQTVILIDAVQSGADPGTIVRFEAHRESLPNVFVPHLSSHGMGVAEAIELAQALEQVPPRLIVYGVEVDVVDTGSGLSPSVVRVVDEAATRITRDLDQFLEPT